VVVRRTGGHTADSSSVVLAGERVVIAGDLVQARRRPYFGEPDTDRPYCVKRLYDATVPEGARRARRRCTQSGGKPARPLLVSCASGIKTACY
jgi:glyoxylase-like metal-dependent hydrolase (beta-lactamase superfamily II)